MHCVCMDRSTTNATRAFAISIQSMDGLPECSEGLSAKTSRHPLLDIISSSNFLFLCSVFFRSTPQLGSQLIFTFCTFDGFASTRTSTSSGGGSTCFRASNFLQRSSASWRALLGRGERTCSLVNLVGSSRAFPHPIQRLRWILACRSSDREPLPELGATWTANIPRNGSTTVD